MGDRGDSGLGRLGEVAPADPVPAAPLRAPGSVRRTSHVDMHWDLPADAEPFARGGLHLRGAARDLRTDAGGAARVLGEARVDARVDQEGALAALHTEPRVGDAPSLLGARVGSGFRQRAEACFPGEHGTPLG